VYGGAIALMVGLNGDGVILRLRVRIERKTDAKNSKMGLSWKYYAMHNKRTSERTALLESYRVTDMKA
jgi:hypothetical protein